MKINTLLSLMLVWVSFSLTAQVEPLAEIQLEGTGKKIIFHEFSGIPIVQTTKSYTAINPVTHEKIWEVARSSSAALLEAADTEGSSTDFIELYNTPYAYLNGTVIHVQTGKVLVDGEKDEIKRFMEYYIIPDADLILIQLGAKGMVRLYGVNPFTNEKQWDVDLREMGVLGQTLAADSAPTYTIPPVFTASGDLLYHNDKYLASINLKNGSLNWNEKLNPGYIFINDDASKLVVAEKRGAIGGAMTLSAPGTGAPNKFSKKMYLIDASTGESLWSKGDTKMDGNIQFIMPYDGGYLVVHDEGCNIYDYNSGKEGEGRWKKDVGMKGIRDVVVEEDGFMIYTRNRRMLIDPATGEDVWKKEEKLEREPRAYSMSPKRPPNEVGNATYYTSGNKIYVKVNNRTRSYLFSGYTVNEDKNELAIYSNESSDPDGNEVKLGYDITVVDMDSGKSKRSHLYIRKWIDAVDAVEDGYFFYNDRGYALLDFKDGEWGKPKKEYYPDPSRGERFLKGVVMSAVTAGAAVKSTGSYLVGNTAGSEAAYNARMDAVNAASEGGETLYVRKVVGRVEAQFAYFFSRNDDGDLVLFKVDKDTGEEVKEYPFDDNQPVYEIDSDNDQLFYLVGGDLKIFAL